MSIFWKLILIPLGIVGMIYMAKFSFWIYKKWFGKDPF